MVLINESSIGNVFLTDSVTHFSLMRNPFAFFFRSVAFVIIISYIFLSLDVDIDDTDAYRFRTWAQGHSKFIVLTILH